MIVELERCMAPASVAEDMLLDEILSLTFYHVDRASRADMARAHMQPQQCHNNAVSYTGRGASQDSQAVSGWWKRDGIFLFHSVVLMNSRLLCVTPHIFPPPLEFAPDPRIEWQNARGTRVARRIGKSVPDIVRVYPAETMAAAREARDALLAMIDLRAVEPPR